MKLLKFNILIVLLLTSCYSFTITKQTYHKLNTSKLAADSLDNIPPTIDTFEVHVSTIQDFTNVVAWNINATKFNNGFGGVLDPVSVQFTSQVFKNYFFPSTNKYYQLFYSTNLINWEQYNTPNIRHVFTDTNQQFYILPILTNSSRFYALRSL